MIAFCLWRGFCGQGADTRRTTAPKTIDAMTAFDTALGGESEFDVFLLFFSFSLFVMLFHEQHHKKRKAALQMVHAADDTLPDNVVPPFLCFLFSCFFRLFISLSSRFCCSLLLSVALCCFLSLSVAVCANVFVAAPISLAFLPFSSFFGGLFCVSRSANIGERKAKKKIFAAKAIVSKALFYSFLIS